MITHDPEHHDVRREHLAVADSVESVAGVSRADALAEAGVETRASRQTCDGCSGCGSLSVM